MGKEKFYTIKIKDVDPHRLTPFKSRTLEGAFTNIIKICHDYYYGINPLPCVHADHVYWMSKLLTPAVVHRYNTGEIYTVTYNKITRLLTLHFIATEEEYPVIIDIPSDLKEVLIELSDNNLLTSSEILDTVFLLTTFYAHVFNRAPRYKAFFIDMLVDKYYSPWKDIRGVLEDAFDIVLVNYRYHNDIQNTYKQAIGFDLYTYLDDLLPEDIDYDPLLKITVLLQDSFNTAVVSCGGWLD